MACCISSPASFTEFAARLESAEPHLQRIDVHVDGKRPVAGERSRFVLSPEGEVFFTYTLAAGDFDGKPLWVIKPNGEIRMSAIDSESTWNVEGWGTFGYPFDLAFDNEGELHVATRHRGSPYGVDYWRRVDGVWRLESFGAGVTFGGNTVSLGLLPGGKPVVICLDHNRTQLTVWERSNRGDWQATRPVELSNVAAGQFDLEVHQDGTLHVVYCPEKGGPVCATRDLDGQWSKQQIAPAPLSRMIAATLDSSNRLHVSFAAGERGDSMHALNYATVMADGTWRTQVVAKSDDARHIGLTTITAAAGRVAVAWELGAGRQFSTKDYGGKVGSVMLTLIDNDTSATHELVSKNGGRPGVALSADGKTAWVGVYTGNDDGDDFYLLNCGLDGLQPLAARALRHEDPNVREKACDALNRVQAKLAASAVRPLLNDADPGVRLAAKNALGVLNDSPSTETLIDLKQWQESASERPGHRLGEVQRRPTEVVNSVVQVGSDKQLLIDDFVIDSSSGLAKWMHPFEKHPRNPVFQAQVPWEEGWVDPFMSPVVYDPEERCFKLWYRCGPRHSMQGYAVSSDGIHWQRPDTAHSAWQQFEHHNLLGFDGRIATWERPGTNVVFFPEASGHDRYLSLVYQPPTGDYALSRSADGVAWKSPRSIRKAYGDVMTLTRDAGRQEYLFFPKYTREHDGFVRRSFAATSLKTLDAPFAAAFPFLSGHDDDARVAEDACRAYGSLLPDTLRLPEFHSEVYSVTAMPYEGVVVALYDLWPVTGSAEGPSQGIACRSTAVASRADQSKWSCWTRPANHWPVARSATAIPFRAIRSGTQSPGSREPTSPTCNRSRSACDLSCHQPTCLLFNS